MIKAFLLNLALNVIQKSKLPYFKDVSTVCVDVSELYRKTLTGDIF